MTEEPKKPSELVKNTESMPCGCVQTTYADDRTQVDPCPPHAIAEAGRLMHQAGQMFNMAAGRLLHDQNQMRMEEAVARAANIKKS